MMDPKDYDYCIDEARAQSKPGEYVADLQSEVARLRDDLRLMSSSFMQASDELATERAAHEATKAELARIEAYAAQCHDESERWAGDVHRACSARQVSDEKLRAAEARVAELERKNDALGRAKDVFASRAYLAEARAAELESERDEYYSAGLRQGVALDQARGLLERAVYSGWDKNMQDESRVWLAAHPEPATPATARDARLQDQGFEPVSEEQREQNRLVNLGQAVEKERA